jgi:hypothetical protein
MENTSCYFVSDPTFASSQYASTQPQQKVVVVHPSHIMKKGVCVDCGQGADLSARCVRLSGEKKN